MVKSIAKYSLTVFAVLSFSVPCFAQEIDIEQVTINQHVTTVLKGEVYGSKVDTLYLYEATADLRGDKIIIPVINGSFECTLEASSVQGYTFIYPYQLHRGSWRPVLFFTDPDTVQFNLYPLNPKKDRISGSELTESYYSLINIVTDFIQPKIDSVYLHIDSLKKSDVYFNETAKELQRRLEGTTDRSEKDAIYRKMVELRKNHSNLTPTGKVFAMKIDSLVQIFYDIRLEYTQEHNSVASFYVLTELIRSADRFKVETKRLKNIYQKYAKKYPAHPYTFLARQTLNANTAIKVGNNFIDFKASTTKGKTYKLSKLIEGKIALLDLWASWCGPCIRKSRKIIPIYQKFKNRGFTVVGVAREFENTRKLKKVLAQENFPWINLVELDDRKHIWRKYGIPYAGGGIFLIGRKGNILAIDPTPDEVRKILKKRL